MARPVKRWFLNLIFITARVGVNGIARKVSGGYPTGVKSWSNGIIKQETSRGYFVQTNDGQGRVRLVAKEGIALGEAYIKATDENGNTYFVTKLTAHKATLVRWTNNEADWLFEDGDQAQWAGTGLGFGNTGLSGVYIENDD